MFLTKPLITGPHENARKKIISLHPIYFYSENVKRYFIGVWRTALKPAKASFDLYSAPPV